MNLIFRYLSFCALLFLTFGCASRQYQVTAPRTKQLVPPPIVAEAPRPPKRELPPPPPVQPKPIPKGVLIVIDPGHGGEDFGTQSLGKPRYQEKNLTLTTSHFLKTFLSQMGYQTIMTRHNDVFIALDQRAKFANHKQPKLFVSVHYNSAPSREAAGVEVYFYKSEEDKARSKQSKRLAESVLKSVISQTQANSRGVKHGNFAVIRETDMPAILVEGGFLTNEDEMDLLKDPVYLKQIAWGIATGIDQFLKKNLPGDK